MCVFSRLLACENHFNFHHQNAHRNNHNLSYGRQIWRSQKANDMCKTDLREHFRIYLSVNLENIVKYTCQIFSLNFELLCCYFNFYKNVNLVSVQIII